MRNKAVLACFSWLTLVGCSGTETGNPGGQVSLALSAQSSDEVEVSLSDAEAGLLVDTALISLDSMALVSCSGEALTHLGAVDVDLTESSPMQFTVEGTASEACGIQFRVVPSATTGSALGDYSLLLGGTRSDGTPFEVRSRLERTVRLDAETPFDPGRLILAFDLAVWLDSEEVHNAVLHQEIAQIGDEANLEILAAIEMRLDLAAELFVDTDGDGELDPEESEGVARAQ